MKKQSRSFFRAASLSAVILLCIGFGVYGMIRAYENTRRIGFGEYKKAVEITDNSVRIFDFEWEIPNDRP